ncbi:MAG: hypothetical protein AB1705_05705 [Verrucomicrobiota bacterium]
MKTVSTTQFYRNASLTKDLPKGGQLLVTHKGKPKFVVTKCGRMRMTSRLARQRSVGKSNASTFDGVAFLRSLKK